MNSLMYQQENGCDIPYDALQPEVVYTTCYPDQPWYLLKLGGTGLNCNAESGVVFEGTGSIYPGNGFHYFRLATADEIYLLTGEKQHYEIY